MTHLWLRHEVRETEWRTPLVPADAARLVRAGHQVTVERSPHRVFTAEEFAAVGARTAAAGSWVDAPADAYILGLKELPPEPPALRHRHVYFGHAYKGQHGAGDLLRRFRAGGGLLLDLEYLTDEHHRRLAAFGYWAGYTGAALAILHLRGGLGPLRPWRRAELDAALAAPGERPGVLVIGALGRCGRGAQDACAVAGARVTAWDLAETAGGVDTAALLAHDVLVNTVLTTGPVSPFVSPADLDDPARRLRVICDVTCDVTSSYNALPIYDRVTSWEQPARPLRSGAQVIAIDNLPALLPREASEAFSADLSAHLSDLTTPPWRRAAERFHTAIEECANAEGALGRHRSVHG